MFCLFFVLRGIPRKTKKFRFSVHFPLEALQSQSVDLLRSVKPDGHVGSSRVVQPDDLLHFFPHLPQVGEVFPVEPLLFQDAVHALRDGVVIRRAVLRHACLYTLAGKRVDVLRAAVLAPAVRMVDQPLEAVVVHLAYRPVQGAQGASAVQRGVRVPSHDAA